MLGSFGVSARTPSLGLLSVVLAAVGACQGGDLPPGSIGDGDDLELCVGEVEVPDEALRGLLEAILPQPEPPEDAEEEPPKVILAEELRKLPGLRAPALGIVDLRGLECAQSLQSLGLSGNAISDLEPLRNLPLLEELQLSGNAVTDLSVLGELTSLRILVLDGNGIEDVSPLATLTSLEYLDVGANAIADVSSLSTLTALTGIVLQKNMLRSIDALAPMKALFSVDLSDNEISDLGPLAEHEALHFADLEGNAIESLAPLRAATQMVSIEASRNALLDLEGIEGMRALNRLVAQENAVTSTAPVDGLALLTVLDLGGNQVTSLAGVQSLVSLRRLALANNDVDDLSAVTGLPEMREIDVRNNPVTDFGPVGTLPLLGALIVGGTDVALDLSPLAGRSVFRRLSFEKGRADSLAFLADLPSIEAVELDDTALSAQAVDDLGLAPTLQTVKISRTGAADLSGLAPLLLLEVLQAEDNAIASIAVLANFPGLVQAKLAGNPLGSLAGVETLEILTDLDVSRTTIADLDPVAANETFRTDDIVDARETNLGPDDCSAIAVIEERLAVVVHDASCP